MPSPSTSILCELVAADLVQCLVGDEAFAPLKTSIPAGNVEYSEDEIRGSIRMPAITARCLPPYTTEQLVSIRATLPLLKQQLPKFDVRKQVRVEFPIELRNIGLPGSLPPRSMSTVRWEVCIAVFATGCENSLTSADLQ